MKKIEQALILKQLDRKIKNYNKLAPTKSTSGWICDIRTSLGMSMEQLGKRLGISAQGVAEMEKREREAGISLKSLDEAAKAFGLRLTYGFSAPAKNLEQLVDEAAKNKAKQIVLRTHKNMSLEKQANSKARINRAINEQAAEIASKRPKYLWD
ncbi:MAG: helix-turn-helix domain-containing protein [Patescibacteria group bacterium]